MSTAQPINEEVILKNLRLALGLTGAVAAVVGLLILVWPGKTAVAVTTIVAVYAIIQGVLYFLAAFSGSRSSGWSRIGHALVGVLFIVAGIVSFANLKETTAGLAIFTAIFIGISWLAEGFIALVTIGSSPSKVWTALFALLSIVAGVFLFLTPLWSAVVLWWLLGISLLAMGIVQAIRAFTLKSLPTV